MEWTNKTFEYDGELHIPKIICLNDEISKLNLKIQGGQTEVGEYTALAVCENTNYILENDVYVVRRLPSVYLLDSEMRIVGKELRLRDVVEAVR